MTKYLPPSFKIVALTALLSAAFCGNTYAQTTLDPTTLTNPSTDYSTSADIQVTPGAGIVQDLTINHEMNFDLNAVIGFTGDATIGTGGNAIFKWDGVDMSGAGQFGGFTGLDTSSALRPGADLFVNGGAIQFELDGTLATPTTYFYADSLDIIVGADGGTVNVNGDFQVRGKNLTGADAGSIINKTGTGTLLFGTTVTGATDLVTDGVDFAGTFDVQDGTLAFGDRNGSDTTADHATEATVGSVELTANGILDLKHKAKLNATNGVDVGAGIFRLREGSELAGTTTVNGGTIEAYGAYSAGGAATLGNVNVTGAGTIAGATANSQLVVGTLTKTGAGTLTITGNSAATAINIQGGITDFTLGSFVNTDTVNITSGGIAIINWNGVDMNAGGQFGGFANFNGLTFDDVDVAVNGGTVRFQLDGTPGIPTNDTTYFYIDKDNITVGANGATVDVADGMQVRGKNVKDGTGANVNSTITKTGTGTLLFGTTATNATDNSGDGVNFTGKFDVQAGTLAFGDRNGSDTTTDLVTVATVGSVTVANSATLDLKTNAKLITTSGGVAVGNGTFLLEEGAEADTTTAAAAATTVNNGTIRATGNATLDDVTATGNAKIDVASGKTLTGEKLTGAAGSTITKNGAGTYKANDAATLGTNSTLNVAKGRFIIDANATVYDVEVHDDAELTFNGTTTVNNDITVVDTAFLILNGNVTGQSLSAAAGTTVSAQSNSSQTFDEVDLGGTYEASGSDLTVGSGSIDGNIVGAFGVFTKNTTGTLILDAASLTVGSLNITDGTAAIWEPVTVTNATTVSGNGILELMIDYANEGSTATVLTTDTLTFTGNGKIQFSFQESGSSKTPNAGDTFNDVILVSGTDLSTIPANRFDSALVKFDINLSNSNHNLSLKIASISSVEGFARNNGMSKNEVNTGSLFDTSAVVTADAVNLSDSDLRNQISRINGTAEVLADAQMMALWHPQFKVFDRLHGLNDRYIPYARSHSLQQVYRGQCDPCAPAGTAMIPSNRNLWFEGYYRSEDVDSDRNARSYDASRGGILVGAEWYLSPWSLGGFVFGYGNPRTNNGYAKVEAEDLTFAAYTNFRLAGNLYTNLLAGFGTQDYKYKAYDGARNFSGNTLHTSIELYKSLLLQNSMQIFPLVAFDYEKSWADGLAIPHASPYTTYIDKQRLEQAVLRIGLNTKVETVEGYDFRGRLQYGYLVGGDPYGTVNARFADSTGSRSLAGVNLSRSMVNIGGGVDMNFSPCAKFFADYDFDFGDKATAHTVQLGLATKW